MSTAPVLHTTIPMHTHRCEACAVNGKEVIWIHPNSDAGQVAAHKCPECGTVNWKQCVVANGKLPQPQPRNAIAIQNSTETIFGYMLLAIALFAVGYLAFALAGRKNNGPKVS